MPNMFRARRGRLLALLLLAAVCAEGSVERVVIIKVDGLSQEALQTYLHERGVNSTNIGRVFGRGGVSLENFYVRGLSLSAPSWSLLDTGQHLKIHGNVEYDRYTLRAWDYLNFFPFYVSYALKRQVDMAGVEFLDEQNAGDSSLLLIDRFPYEQGYQGFQLLQRGIRWETLRTSLQTKFAGRPVKEVFDEWQTGFSFTEAVMLAQERDLLRALKDPKVKYLDYFTGEFDHTAHLTGDHVVQMHLLDSLDALVGRVWRAVQDTPLAAKTLLVTVSDHGMNSDEHVISQGYNLVDWFGSATGGGHHVITDRHPLTEFKLKGLNPFVSEVITPSRESRYLDGRSADYPTVVLDLDGNERASIGLRDNTLGILQVLLQQWADRRTDSKLRVVARAAILKIRDGKKAEWQRRAADLQGTLELLRTQIRTLEPQLQHDPRKVKWSADERAAGIDKIARRLADRLERARAQEHADAQYLASLNRLLALSDADFEPGKLKIEELIPPKSLGELNSIYDLRHYVTGLGERGLVFDTDGSIDLELSFQRTDYFQALSAIAVRNNVQKNVQARPVDFIALALNVSQAREATGDESIDGAVWLRRGEERQALILTRVNEIRYIPIRSLEQNEEGQIHFERCEWAAGFPLEMLEDPALAVEGDRAAWLSAWHSEQDWLNAVHRGKYSNGVIGITEQLLDRNEDSNPTSAQEKLRLRTDLLVFANNHWNFNVRGFNPGGNHGSFLRPSTHSVWMMSGAEMPQGLQIDAPYDSLSFAPTILRLMGRAETKLPGLMVKEVF